MVPGCTARKLALGGKDKLAAGGGRGSGCASRLRPSEPAAQPQGAKWCFGTAGKPAERERLRDKKKMGDTCVWPTVICVIVICDVNTF